MVERQVLDLRSGVFWTFVITHPKGTQPRLIIQPPEGNPSKHAPEFDASEISDWLNGFSLFWAQT